MSEIALQLECSVEAEVSPAFAWQFRTNVANWNDPPATFTLDGPFEEGYLRNHHVSRSGAFTMAYRSRRGRYGIHDGDATRPRDVDLSNGSSTNCLQAGRNSLNASYYLGRTLKPTSRKWKAGFGPNLGGWHEADCKGNGGRPVVYFPPIREPHTGSLFDYQDPLKCPRFERRSSFSLLW